MSIRGGRTLRRWVARGRLWGRRILLHRMPVPVIMRSMQRRMRMSMRSSHERSRMRWSERVREGSGPWQAMRIARIDRGVFAFLVLQAHFPTCQQFRTRLDVRKLRVLERALELAGDDIFEAVIGDDVMVSPLVLYGNGLLHQASLLELVTINKRATKTPLLFGRECLREVCVSLCTVCLQWGVFTRSFHGRVLIFVPARKR